MRILAIETSGRLGSAALLQTDDNGLRVVAERATPEGVRTAQSLLPTIDELLRAPRWRPADIELVCVAAGPGSFTGLRIGVVAAKTLAYATGAKLVGVHTLAAIAYGVDHGAATRASMVLDAQRQELFVARFDQRPIVEQPDPPTDVTPIGEWLAQLEPGEVIAGPPLAKLRHLVPQGVAVAPESSWNPAATAVGRLGFELYSRGVSVDPLALVPRYFRKSAAEEKASRKAAR